MAKSPASTTTDPAADDSAADDAKTTQAGQEQQPDPGQEQQPDASADAAGEAEPVAEEPALAPASVMSMLAAASGPEAHAIHVRLYEMMPFIDGAIASTEPALAAWLAQLKSDLA